MTQRMENIIKIVEQYEASELTVDETIKKISAEIKAILWEDQT